jgi:hypothetical protein
LPWWRPWVRAPSSAPRRPQPAKLPPGPVAQRTERRRPKAGVAGSTPAGVTRTEASPRHAPTELVYTPGVPAKVCLGVYELVACAAGLLVAFAIVGYGRDAGRLLVALALATAFDVIALLVLPPRLRPEA